MIPQLSHDNYTDTGVVITTNGDYGVFARQAVEAFLRELPGAHICLFINESTDPITLELQKRFPQIHVTLIENQTTNGGLTATWNEGIRFLINDKKCDNIILSNDDIVFDSSVRHIVQRTRDAAAANSNKYFGPVTNNPGPAALNQAQYALTPLEQEDFVIRDTNGKMGNLNGFFMAFPKAVLEKNKFGKKTYFDPAYPFGGNEVEWFNRFRKRCSGEPVVVPKTFVYHYKIARWRPNLADRFRSPSSACVYTVNLGGYERDRILEPPPDFDIPILYFCDTWTLFYKSIQLRMLPFFVQYPGLSPKLAQRIIKTSPHSFLPRLFDVSLYIDGNVSIRTTADTHAIIATMDYENQDIICFEHPRRSHVAAEMQVVVQERLEKPRNVLAIKNRWKECMFLDNVGLTETNVLLRRHKNTLLFNQEWTDCIKICIRDQISFDFLLFKHKVKYKRLTFEHKNHAFELHAHINPINRTISTKKRRKNKK